jgi:cytochrome bd-type quinol oxidase subunit 1
MLGLQVTAPQFPGIGNSLPVGILFILHIAVAEFSVGAITLATIMEWRSVRKRDARAARYARAAANSYYLVFSLGATLAVFAVVLLFGLWGNEFGQLMNILLPLIAFAFTLFLVITPILVIYRNSFDKMQPRSHALLGTLLAVLQSMFVVAIVGLDAYLITPFHGGFLDVALNAAYFPLLLHRLIGNVSWTALFFAAYAAVRLRTSAQEEERGFQAWAARLNLRIGLLTALAMPIDGFVMVLVLQNYQHGFFENLVAGQNAWMMVLQETFLAIVLIGGNVALSAERRWAASQRSTDSLGLAAIALSLAGMVLATLPSSVLPASAEIVRFIGLGIAIVVTGIHLAVRWRHESELRRPTDGIAPALRLGRRALVVVGAFALLTSLLMGVIKESARGNYGIYGELTQAEAHQNFNPPGSLYP